VTHPFTGISFGPGGTTGGSTFGSVQGVAADQGSGDVYVFDGAAGKLYKFDESGEPADFSSLATNVIEGVGGGSSDQNPAAEKEIAVAPAGAPGGTAGDIYVANGAHSFKVYSPAGQELPEVGTGGETCGVATDPAGHIYAGIYPSAISEYTPSANPPIATDKTAENTEVNVGLCNVAADGSGNVYAANYGEGVYKLEGLADSTPTKLDASANSIGIDPSNGDVYADRRGEVAQYSASGALLGTFGADLITRSRGVAVSVAAEKVYVGSSATVKIFGPTVPAATVQTGEATNLTSSSARLNGTVNPEGVAVTECKFEYKAEAGEAYASVPCAESSGEIGAGTTPVAVHADASELIGSTEYSFRLVVKNGKEGVTQGLIKIFKTPGPAVSGLSILAISDHGAIFKAQVNPNSQETSYVFQYVSEEEFQASGFTGAKSVPAGGEAIGAGSEPVEVKQAVSDLSLETSYRVRIVATNEGGVTTSVNRAFRTYGTYAPGLGDGRAYEQVSSPDKHGQDIRANASTVHAAEDGNRITFYSSMALPEGESAQDFPSYLATRSSTPAAWSTQGIQPSVASGQYGTVKGWSEDLSATFAFNKDKVVGGTWNFLLRESGGNLLTIAGGMPPGSSVFFAAASQGSTEVYFETSQQLLPEAPEGRTNAYIWDRATGELRLAGVLNDGNVASSTGTIAGPYAWMQENTMAGGRERGYYTQPNHALSQDGSVAFFTSTEAGQLYARLNPTAEQSPLNGAEECVNPQLACTLEVSASQRTGPDPNGEKPAAFLSATPDGSKVFFLSNGKLTDDATTGPSDQGSDLYSYDTRSNQLVDLTPDAADPNGAEVRGLLGTSEDGSYVYFAANGVLAPGASAGNCREVNFNFQGTCNLYLRHEGVITFITSLQAGGGGAETTDVWNWIPTTEVSTGRPRSGRVSSDGKTLLFFSSGQHSSYENEGRAELYRYRVGTPGLTCVSCVPTGAPPSAPLGDGTSLSSAERVFGPGGMPAFTRNLSADGNRVFFETLDKLIPADTNGDAGCPILNPRKFGPETRACRDVYEWEAKGTGSCESESQDGGCLYLVSAGTREEPSYFLDASTSGNDAFILTRDRLVGQDEDDLEDIYDARVGGGIASQNPEKVSPCEGEACKGPAAAPPGSPSAGTAVFVGPGNQKAQAKKAKKHKKKRHGRNQKKKHQKHASKRQARAHR
jgi:hypothetical protein